MNTLPYQAISERQVVTPLLQSSPPFKAFYEAERPTLGTVAWFINPALGQPGQISAQTILSESGNVIFIAPVRPSAFTVAHELMHIRMRLERYPMAYFPPGDPVADLFNGLFNSLFTDPLINKRLAVYGLDQKAHYLEETQRTKQDLKNKHIEPNPVKLFGAALGYYGQVLEYRAWACTHTPDSFQRWYEKKFPAVAKERMLLDQRLKGVDLDSRHGQETALNIVSARMGEILNG